MAVDNIATLGIKVDPRKAITGSNKAKRAIKGIGAAASKVKSRIFSLNGALGALGAGAVLRSAFKYTQAVEDLGVQLKFLTGNTDDASKAFKIMIKFAKEAPFALQEIQKASPSLLTVAKNVDEMNQLLEITGDIASSSTLTFEQVAQQLQRTFSGGISAADLFRDAGIKAMLGFEEGVAYTSEQSRKHILGMWSDGTAKMKGATKDMANTFTGQVSMMGDAWDNLMLTFMKEGLFDETKNSVQDITKWLTSPETIQGAKDLGSGITDIALGVTDIITQVNKLPKWVLEVGILMALLGGKKARLAVAGMTAMAVAIGKIIDAYKDLGSADEVLDKHFEKQEELFNRFGKRGQSAIIGTNSQKDYGIKNEQAKKIQLIKNETKALEAKQKALHAIESHFESERLPDFVLHGKDIVVGWKEVPKVFRDLNTTLSSTANSFDVVGNKIDRDTNAIQKMADAIREAKLDELLEDVTRSMEESITNAIMNIGQGVSSLKDMFKDLARIILRQFVQIQVAKPASSWLANNLNLGKLFGSFDGGGFTGAGARTGGVDNKGGFPAILHPNETVIDHTKGSQAGMGGNVNVSFNITANDTDGFDELLESRRGMIINLINSAMNDRGTMGVV